MSNLVDNPSENPRSNLSDNTSKIPASNLSVVMLWLVSQLVTCGSPHWHYSPVFYWHFGCVIYVERFLCNLVSIQFGWFVVILLGI